MDLPRLIQGGMGAGVSGWQLAQAVASLNQLGVVSGTALDTILVRRLGLGDPHGDVRRALSAFPAQDVAARVLKRYFRAADTQLGSVPITSPAMQDDEHGEQHEHHASPKFGLIPLQRAKLTPEREWLIILANFVEVFLAKEGHSGVVGINYLHKIQFPVLPSLYGAMLAGVDVVLVGAGIPGEIPAVMDDLAEHKGVSVALDVLDAGDQKFSLQFEPATLWASEHLPIPAPLRRPQFLAIVSSATLARALLKKAPGGINGFVVEAPIAGGHNAPPRGPQHLSDRGEPVYGERDEVDMAQMAGLGTPFWLAGGYATREKMLAAIALGARGIQVGTAFAFCEQSGLDPILRERFLAGVLHDEREVFTDPDASPTSFPFKVAGLEHTLSDRDVYEHRTRACDLGYLRRAYRKADGTVDYRCPAEPVDDYVRKGGKPEDTVGRKCLCNSLMANIGLGQVRADGYIEPALLTAGNDLACIKQYITQDRRTYHAKDVIDSLVVPS
jgi:nitronate monooxygenase